MIAYKETPLPCQRPVCREIGELHCERGIAGGWRGGEAGDWGCRVADGDITCFFHRVAAEIVPCPKRNVVAPCGNVCVGRVLLY